MTERELRTQQNDTKHFHVDLHFTSNKCIFFSMPETFYTRKQQGTTEFDFNNCIIKKLLNISFLFSL